MNLCNIYNHGCRNYVLVFVLVCFKSDYLKSKGIIICNITNGFSWKFAVTVISATL
jgi:hypothetical protein